jgi:hypothetical protein
VLVVVHVFYDIDVLFLVVVGDIVVCAIVEVPSTVSSVVLL